MHLNRKGNNAKTCTQKTNFKTVILTHTWSRSGFRCHLKYHKELTAKNCSDGLFTNCNDEWRKPQATHYLCQITFPANVILALTKH